jgi:hypothetical protein
MEADYHSHYQPIDECLLKQLDARVALQIAAARGATIAKSRTRPTANGPKRENGRGSTLKASIRSMDPSAWEMTYWVI